MLEVRIIDLEYRVPYGVNNSGPGVGVLPDLLKAPARKVIRLDTKRNVALFSPEIEIPLQPFMGIMAVAPTKESWMISSRPPWRWGGNMDFNKLTVGATLYLPVFHEGARFFTGDSHAVQGDGEVNGTAIEASLTGTFQFIVHKGGGKTMFWPRAEDADYYYTMGMDLDLDVAMRKATEGDGSLSAGDTRAVGGRRLFARQHRRRLPHRRGGRRRAVGLWRDPEADIQNQSGILVQALRARWSREVYLSPAQRRRTPVFDGCRGEVGARSAPGEGGFPQAQRSRLPLTPASPRWGTGSEGRSRRVRGIV